MKVSKGQPLPEIVAAGFLLLCMVLGSAFVYQVLIVTQVWSYSFLVGSLDSYVVLCLLDLHVVLILSSTYYGNGTPCNAFPMFDVQQQLAC